MAIDSKIFKAYDIRGVVPEEFTSDMAEEIARALVDYLQVKQVAVGHDMRISSPDIAAAVCRGITRQGADAIDLGLTQTDELYFAVGKFKYPAGVMITASHNPAKYNGMKFCREEAIPLSSETGTFEIRDLALAGKFKEIDQKGQIIKRDVLEDFITHLLSFIDPGAIKPLKIVIDAGNGMAGMVSPEVFKRLPITLVPLYFDLDGRFPNHPASPIEPENMVDLQRAVRENGADLGAAFDGDADRVFIVDEKADLIGGDMVTALVSKSLLRRHKGATILYNLICSRSVPEIIEREGGNPIRTRVGHSFIKAKMRETNAIFGGEHSGHFYFRDNWFADSGMIALLIILELISQEGKKVSELLKPLDTRFRSGEVNTEVRDIPGKLKELEQKYSDAKMDHLDGTTFQYADWWFNVRPSNTEPLLRLNLEADTQEQMEAKRAEVLDVIRE